MVGVITANSSSKGNEEYKVITLALAAHTLKFAIRSTFHSKDGSKKSIHVHKAIEEYMLERFK